MFTALLERGSWVICKLGMPLVFFYHLILGSVFLNTAAEDAHGLEKIANTVLIPVHYFFEGKKAIPILDKNGHPSYLLERRFDYTHHFFVKTASSIAAFPFSITLGSTLKALSYLSSETRQRAERIKVASQSTHVECNLSYYRSLGMPIEDLDTASFIAPPQYARNPKSTHRLATDLQALKEIVRILNHHKIPYWIDCGTCLGAYRYGGCIPHDWDIDIGVLSPDFSNIKNALQELDPEKFVVQDWSGRALPKTYLKVFVRESGGMIDLYHFGIDPETKTIHTILSNEFNIFLPHSWKAREKRYTIPMPFEFVFPLKKALFEGFEVPVPGQIEKYLQKFYGENLSPAHIYNELTDSYEKDLSHPYWQTPYAH